MKNQINELADNGYKITINRNIIAQKVAKMSEEIKDQIKNELKGKMCSIVMDVCKKRTFAVLGVSSFVNIDGVTTARSLGLIHLTERHRGPYMADQIEDLLKEYDVPLKNVYTAKADKASNMDNTVRHLAIYATGEHPEPAEVNLDEQYDDQSQEMLHFDSDDEMDLDYENLIEIENELYNDERYEELIDELTTELLRRNNFLSLINQVDCCSHKVQLAVNRSIDNSNAKPTIDAVRDMAKLLRTTVVNIEFRKLQPNCILPPLNVETRWNSDYLLVRLAFYDLFDC